MIVVLVDGVSADYVTRNRDRLPNLSRLAAGGLHVRRLRSPIPATSMTGRASMLTGYEADRHGIYGNRLWQDETFVSPLWTDVRMPSLAALAARNSLRVACIGHALIDPDACVLHVPAPWMRGAGFLKGPIAGPLPGELHVKDPDGLLRGVPLPSLEPLAGKPSPVRRAVGALTDDLLIMEAVTHVALRDDAPDLILTELNATDTYQHDFGYESAEAHVACAHADMLIGHCVERLERAGKSGACSFGIASDHGHGAVSRSVYPSNILPPKWRWQAEGAMLHVVAESEDARAEAIALLGEYGVEPWSGAPLPPPERSRLLTFAAPLHHDFADMATDDHAEVFGPSRYRSTHSWPPGDPRDDRFCIFSGPQIAHATIETAAPGAFAPTVLHLLGVGHADFPEPALPVTI